MPNLYHQNISDANLAIALISVHKSTQRETESEVDSWFDIDIVDIDLVKGDDGDKASYIVQKLLLSPKQPTSNDDMAYLEPDAPCLWCHN